MRADLRPDPILQRRDDLAARGVVLGIGGEHEHDVQGKPDGVALDLNVTLLEDVEQSDLDLAGEVGQLVDGEHPPVGSRQQPVVHCQVARQLDAASRRLDRVDVTDDVGNRDVRGGQLLDVARVAGQPGDRHRLSFALGERPARAADRRERVVVDLASLHHRDRLVEKACQSSQDPALGLPAQAEEDEVVAREDRVDELRDDRVVVADDSWEDRATGTQLPHQVLTDFILDAPAGDRAAGHRRAEGAEGRDAVVGAVHVGRCMHIPTQLGAPDEPAYGRGGGREADGMMNG